MFEQTATGYVVTEATLELWASRDTCPSCGSVTTPVGKTDGGGWRYICECNGVVEWTA